MGVKSFMNEVRVKVSPARMFKALLLQSNDVLPKAMPSAIKGSEVLGGGPPVSGCILQTNIIDGANIKHVKYKLDTVDPKNYVCKFYVIEGDDVLGNKLEKIYHDTHYEPMNDGGCVIKFNSKYHGKGNIEPSDEEIKADKEKTVALFKAVEAYLIANPHVCA